MSVPLVSPANLLHINAQYAYPDWHTFQCAAQFSIERSDIQSPRPYQLANKLHRVLAVHDIIPPSPASRLDHALHVKRRISCFRY